MTALLLAYDFPPIPGGIARALGEIARHGAGEFVVSTGTLPGAEASDGGSEAIIDRVGVPSGRLRTLPGLIRWGLRARTLVRARRPEFIWAGNVKPAGHVARWLGARERIPYGLMVYGLDLALLGEQCRRSLRRRRVIRRLLGDAAGVVAISHWTRDRCVELAESLGLPDFAGRVRVVPLGVDRHRFHPGAAGPGFRERLGLGEGPWLLTVARLMPHKGIDAGLALVAELQREGFGAGYLVAGEGPDRPRLERRAAALGLAGQVRFLGHVPEADLPALYASADLYLGLSRPEGLEVEGFGLSLLEAQASGLAVLAGRGGGTVDAVTHGVTGFLVDPAEPAAALAAARELLRDASRRRAMGAAGRARMEREFRWERVVVELGEASRAFSGRGWRDGR